MPRKPPNPSLARPLAPGQSDKRRTGVANGTATLPPEGNPHGWWGRRYAEILTARLSDMGGADSLSENQVALARHATTLDVELERRAADLSAEKDVSLGEFATALKALAAVIDRLGISRVKPLREVNPVEATFARPYDGGHG